MCCGNALPIVVVDVLEKLQELLSDDSEDFICARVVNYGRMISVLCLV